MENIYINTILLCVQIHGLLEASPLDSVDITVLERGVDPKFFSFFFWVNMSVKRLKIGLKSRHDENQEKITVVCSQK